MPIINQDLDWARKLVNKLSDDQRYAVSLLIQDYSATQTERVRAMRESLQFIRDMSEKWGYVTIFNTADQSLNQESLGDGK